MQLANVYLATRDAQGVENFAWCQEESREELVALLANPLLISCFRSAKKMRRDVPLPKLESSGNIVVNNEILGRAETVFLRALPIEPRLRVAYEIMYEEFLKFLFLQGFPMLAFDGHQLTVFVPKDQSFDKEAMWKGFVDFMFDENIELIQRNYYALAALHTLGMGPPKQPIFSKQHAMLLVAFCRTAWADRRSQQKDKIEKQLKDFALLSEIKRLDHLFKGKPQAKGKYGFFQKADRVGKYVLEEVISKLNNDATYDQVPAPFIAEPGYLGIGTDFVTGHTDRFCYGCGRTLNNSETFTSSKLVYESSKQRPQSGFREMQENIFVCHLCFFSHLFSPLYPEADNVIVEVRPRKKASDMLSQSVRIESVLRGVVLNEVGLASGRFFELREATDAKKKIGSLPYLYYKLSRVQFMPRFVKENCFILLGEGMIELSSELILFLRTFKRLNLFARDNLERKAHEMTLKSIISNPPHPFTALYHYAHAQGKRKDSDWYAEVNSIHLSIIRELGGENTAKKEEFERIIGVAKIFDTFINQAINGAGKSRADFQKLTQSIDNIEILSEFGYRFAELAKPDQQRPFVSDLYEPIAYECAKKVLIESGVNVNEEINEYGRSIQLNLDALKAVMLKVLDWTNGNAQDYQRFMNKVKYDVLARYPAQLKTRRGA